MKKIAAASFAGACLLSNIEAMQQGQTARVFAERYVVHRNDRELATVDMDPTEHRCVLNAEVAARTIYLRRNVLFDYFMSQDEKIAALRRAYGSNVQIDVRDILWEVWRRRDA